MFFAIGLKLFSEVKWVRRETKEKCGMGTSLFQKKKQKLAHKQN
jgi:hypothetical protein